MLPWSVTLAALHGGARIMRVVGGRPTDRPDTPATPFTQPAEGETSIRRPYVLWIICFSKTTAGEIQLPLVMLPQFSLMLETAQQNNSGWKLEAVFFVCFLPQFPLFASRSAPAAPLLLVLHQKNLDSLLITSTIIVFGHVFMIYLFRCVYYFLYVNRL